MLVCNIGFFAVNNDMALVHDARPIGRGNLEEVLAGYGNIIQGAYGLNSSVDKHIFLLVPVQ